MGLGLLGFHVILGPVPEFTHPDALVGAPLRIRAQRQWKQEAPSSSPGRFGASLGYMTQGHMEFGACLGYMRCLKTNKQKNGRRQKYPPDFQIVKLKISKGK